VPQPRHHFRKIAKEVIHWFGRNARDLPWRRTADPYAIWISEVMLQQTQVKTVLAYWERWMKLFPNIFALAHATEPDVLKAWEGLGYYTRARNLQAAARKICSEYGGKFPNSYEGLIALPGIGRYTAGAICSIAFGQRTAILDGNVARVLSRFFMVPGALKETATQRKLWSFSGALVQAASNTSALNQGLMELGAIICLPRAPLCSACPLGDQCQARRQKRVEEFPERAEAVELKQRAFIALLLRRGDLVLVRQRAGDVVNGGLWEFPNVEFAAAQSPSEAIASFGMELDLVKTIKHTITRNRITLHAFAGTANGNSRALATRFAAQWRPLAELAQLPFSSAHAKLRAFLQGPAEVQIGRRSLESSPN
jgi:A/G-specific adenine glycosylase